MEVFEKARNHLNKDSQKEINVKFREFLLERGNSVYTLNRNPVSVSTDFPPEKQASLKRVAEEPPTPTAYPYAKQTRFEAPTQQGYGYTYPQQGQTQVQGQAQPYPTNDYYNQQPQQQPWQS